MAKRINNDVTPISIRQISSTQEFESLKENWGTLLQKNYTQSAFLSWEWLFSWWKIFSQEKSLWLVTAWKLNHLIGIAPLMLKNRKKLGFTLRVLCTLGTPMNDIGGFLIKNQDINVTKAILSYIVDKSQEWDLFELSEFAISSPEIKVVKDIFAKSGIGIIQEANQHYYISIDKTWDDYYNSLSKKFRKNLRRAERNSSDLGTISIQQYTGSNLKWEHIEAVIAVIES